EERADDATGRITRASKEQNDSGARPHGEAAVGQLAERVLGVEAAEHHPGALGPGQGLRGGDPAVDLESSALEDPVLGPGAGKVLDAGNLGVGDLPARPEASDPVAVGVAGEVPDQRATAGDHVDERLGVSGVDAE